MAIDPVIELARRKKGGVVRHTREVHSEALSQEIRDFLQELANQVTTQNVRMVELIERLAAAEAMVAQLRHHLEIHSHETIRSVA